VRHGAPSVRRMQLFGRKGGAGDPRPDPRSTYLGLRRQVLTLTPAALAREGADGLPVLAAIMETRYPAAVATLAGVADGTTSLYFSNGGGVIGAGARREVAVATARWLAVCGVQLPQLEPMADPELPGEGQTRLMAVTPSGLVGALVPTAELGERRHVLAPLFFAAHGVITQVRLSEAAA
jgi:hypothetical protein